jgi:hypothetical protein
MTDPVDKALAASGATLETSDSGAVDVLGAPAPAAALNTPPVVPVEPVVPPAVPDEPVVPAEPAEPAVPGADVELDTATWGTTGDDVGDSVLTLLQNSGVSVADAKALMFDAMKAGDVSKVDKVSLVEKVGSATANLILAGAENFVTRAATAAQTVLTEVHGAVGGADNWTLLAGWAAKTFTPVQIAEYKALIDTGGAHARFAAQEMQTKYNADTANSTLPAATAEITPDATAVTSARSITRQVYAAEMSKAHKAGDATAMKEIQQARERGRTAGL